MFGHKQTFFSSNDLLVARAEELATSYLSQPKRTTCKVCESLLHSTPDVLKGGVLVAYSFCDTCGHLNGLHKDTPAYNQELYESAKYQSNYEDTSEVDFLKRVSDVYIPKAAFMFENIDEPISDNTFLDIGCGSGHFVQALLEMGATNVVGIDISDSGLRQAKYFVNGARFERVDYAAISDYLNKLKPEFVSFIGVLEHLEDPIEVLTAVRQCVSVKMVFASVPMFSLSVFLEAADPTVFPRQLSGGHTHLFTESSINYLANEVLKFETVGEWWFGTDIFDLYRFLNVKLRNQHSLVRQLDDQLAELIDDLQLVLDQARACSELHVAWKRVA